MNVIWIVADTVRQDHIGAYGNKEIHTPSLDALAARSVRFNNHYAASFPTMPARADYHTGRWSLSFMNWGPLPQGQETLAELLVQGGFTTAAAVDTPFYQRSEMNYDRGFQAFFTYPGQLMGGYHWTDPDKFPSSFSRDEEKGIQTWGTHVARNHESWDARAAWRFESDRCAPQTITLATQWLERHYNRDDFFLYVDTWDPHEPWDAPNYYTELYWPDFDGEAIYPIYGRWKETPGVTEEMLHKAHAAYCGELTMVDTWIGRLLRTVENMGLMEKTAIVFTADHGFQFGERGIFGKMSPPVQADGTQVNWSDRGASWGPNPLYKENVLVPLLIYVPGIAPGVYQGLTSAVDIMPTILDTLNQDVPAFVQGRSLLPQMRDTSLPGREFVVSSEPFTNPGEPVRYVDNLLRRRAGISMVTVTTDEWSFLYGAEPQQSELYHLPSDPKQLNNVITQHPEVAKEHHQRLVQFMRETNVAPHLFEARAELRL